MTEVVEALRDGGDTTVVLVLHDTAQAARYDDRRVVLKTGRTTRGDRRRRVTADLLADVFGIEATVVPGEHGPQITPLRPLHCENAPDPR